MMIETQFNVRDYIRPFAAFERFRLSPWELCNKSEEIILRLLQDLSDDYAINDGIAIHKTAKVENYAILKSPCIIGAGCFVAAFSYLRGGVWLEKEVIVGPSAEVKSSFMFASSKLAHLNFVGDSVIGANVNIEAGAVIANYRNESEDKQIYCRIDATVVATGVNKFGALVGDGCRIGANAVLSPGTVLPPGTVIKRLALVDQSRG